ncbi:MAG: class D sortase [Patescibacteria group bacterium]|nr:class D sortase [Patescibacteria group bacterium]
MSQIFKKIILKIKNKNKSYKIFIFILLGILLFTASFWLYNRTQKQPNKLVAGITSEKTTPAPQKTSSKDWKLKIKKLNITAPIILNVDGANKEIYFQALQNGVAHMKNTALPGEGNTVIFGHSNFYENDPGLYKKVFMNLDQLIIGDEIKIIDKNQEIIYQVNETKIVDPTETSIVQPTINKQLTLITCWPPGTIDQRLIIIADLK